MKKKFINLDEIIAHVGDVLYDEWRGEGSHEFEQVQDRDLLQSEYIDMYVNWRYTNFLKTEKMMGKSQSYSWDGN